MRIVFIAGCLAPGRDGVGDYTRMLARECRRRGHTVALVALAEPHPVATSLVEDAGMQVLRLTLDQAGDGRAVREWVQAFAPDVASLHAVPYSFHPRGFFGARVPLLSAALAPAARRHIFFHELWIGMARGAAWKERASGWWQRRAVEALLRSVAPDVVHTSNAYYQAALASIGREARVLPVFGSVPLPEGPVASVQWAEMPAGALVCGMFGSLHPNWASEPFVTDFAALANREGRSAVIAAAGGLRHGLEFFQRLKAQWAGRVSFVALGEQPVERLAEVFARFDFAVSASPWTLIGKSASAAGLREHGLGVVITNPGELPRFAWDAAAGEPGDSGLLPYFRERSLLTRVPARTVPRPGVAAAADVFLRDLLGSGGGRVA